MSSEQEKCFLVPSDWESFGLEKGLEVEKHLCLTYSSFLQDDFETMEKDDDGVLRTAPLLRCDKESLEHLIWFMREFDKDPFSIPFVDEIKVSSIKEILPSWAANFVLKGDNPNMELICKLAPAANFLGVESLVRLLAATLAVATYDKTIPHIAQIFGCEGEITEEELKAVEEEEQRQAKLEMKRPRD